MHEEVRLTRSQWLESHYEELAAATRGYIVHQLRKLPGARFDATSVEKRDLLHIAIERILSKDDPELLTFEQCCASINAFVNFVCCEVRRMRRLRNRLFDALGDKEQGDEGA